MCFWSFGEGLKDVKIIQHGEALNLRESKMLQSSKKYIVCILIMCVL